MTDDTDGWIDDWMMVTAAQSDVKCSVMVLCIIVHHYIWIYYLFFPLFIFFIYFFFKYPVLSCIYFY